MSNATSAASSSSASGSQPARVPSPVPTVSGEGRYGENILYPNGLHPNPYQLLHLFNSEQYDNQIRAAADQHNQLEPCVKSLFFLRTQRKLFERIVESCSLEIVNQVMYACNYKMGLAGPITIPEKCQSTLIPSPSASSTNLDEEPMGMDTLVPTSTISGVSSPDSCPNLSPAAADSLALPIPPPNPTTPSFILTPLPIPTSSLRSSLSTPPPHYSPELRPPLTPEIFRHLRPQFLPKVEHIPVVGGEGMLEERKDEDTEQENRIPENDDAPPTLKLRSPTPLPTPMTQLVARVSALCADWNAISPDIAHSTCAVDASKLSLDIHLATAPTNEGLAALHVEGLIRENVEELMQEYDRDAQLLFVGADLRKTRLLSVEERLAMGWQPPSEFPPMPRLGTVDDMPDTSYDYNTELYGDDLVDKLKTAKVFTKLDLCNGYNNIWIKDGGQWKAAFKTPRGLFEPTVMFFSLTNSPAMFQVFMNDILKDFIEEGWCVVYMDDILIFSDEINLHRLCTRHVLEHLQENNLYLKLEKCKFKVTKTLFLGMVITPGHISMDERKLARIKDWEAPRTIKGVQSFLGFANFYCKFIGKYAELA
uniref:Reverse transcriptase domain-containing protein n=1 Tax=Moniliophthora roreri TaxID=221103 RepID=A0A0W0G394_MONRR